MSKKGVRNGLRFEALVMYALTKRGLHVVKNDRAMKLMDVAAKSDLTTPLVKQQYVSAVWLVDKLLAKQTGNTHVTATGGVGFYDLVLTSSFNTAAAQVGISCKWNSDEINGTRVTPRNYEHIPAHSQLVPTSEHYRNECDQAFSFILTAAKKHGTFSTLPHDDKVKEIYRPIRSALTHDLKAIKDGADTKRLFIACMGDEDYYVLRGGSLTRIMGVNPHGTLTCRKLVAPTKITHVKPNGEMDNDVTVTFRGGWQLKWRVKNKSSKLTDGALGITLSVVGTPDKLYSETK